MMQFTINCPNDGEVVVTMNDVESMVIHEGNRADITFRCPKCGQHIGLSTPVPSFLASTMENLSKDLGMPMEDGRIFINNIISGDGDTPLGAGINQEEVERRMREMFTQNAGTAFRPKELDESDRAHMDYFRHELADVQTVEDFLEQTDE